LNLCRMELYHKPRSKTKFEKRDGKENARDLVIAE
jgi:hypothetical protein